MRTRRKPDPNRNILASLAKRFGREARASRRRAKTPVREGRFSDMEEYLENYGPDQPFLPAGYFDGDEQEVVMFKGDRPDVEEHELTHAEQFNPLRGNLGFNPYRIQDPTTRRAFRKIYRGIDEENFEGLDKKDSDMAKYMLFKPEEFEAIVRGAVLDADKFGVDFTKDFDTVQEQLRNMGKDGGNVNLRLLRGASKALRTQKEKDLFLKAIQSNLPS